MTQELIERIYEAAFVPETWPAILRTMAEGTASLAGALIIHRPNATPLWTGTPELQDVGTDYCENGGWQRSQLTRFAMTQQPAGFVLDVEFFPDEILQAEAGTTPMALGQGRLLTNITAMPSGEFAVLTLGRRESANTLEESTRSWLNHLRPHLARAALITARLELERANTTVETLSRLGLAAAVLTPSSILLAANAQFEALGGLFQFGAFDKLLLHKNGPAALFREAVSQTGMMIPAVRSIPTPAYHDHPPAIIHISPIKRTAFDIFSRAGCLVVVTPVGKTLTPSGAMLHGLFDLTPAEARVVQKLADGLTINMISVQTGLSVATLRTQLRSVFAKTGTHRQAELLQLIGSAKIAPATDL